MAVSKHLRGIAWMQMLIGVIVGITTLWIALVIFFPSKPYSQNLRLATHQTKEIHIALLDFQEIYGSYPCSDTHAIVTKESHYDIPTSDDANSYLAQLIAADSIDTEKNFHIHRFGQEGDDVFAGAEKILAKGENSLGYVLLNNGRPVSNLKNPKTPMIVALVTEGGSNPTFERKIFTNKSFYVDCSGAVTVFELDEQGKPLDTTPFPATSGGHILDVKAPR